MARIASEEEYKLFCSNCGVEDRNCFINRLQMTNYISNIRHQSKKYNYILVMTVVGDDDYMICAYHRNTGEQLEVQSKYLERAIVDLAQMVAARWSRHPETNVIDFWPHLLKQQQKEEVKNEYI